MDFELIIKDFFDNVSIGEMVKRYNIKYTRLCGIIKQYCIQNNIDFNDEIQAKLELPIDEIYELRKKGLSYVQIGNKYGCTDETIKRHLIQYSNQIKIPYQLRLLLDLKEILINAEKKVLIEYKDWLFLDKVKQQFIKHCENNNIDVSNMKIRIELPMNQIYKEKQSGIGYRELGKKYDYTHQMIKVKLEKYCKQTGLEYPGGLPNSNTNDCILQDNNIDDIEIPIFKISDELKSLLPIVVSKEKEWIFLNELKQEFIKHCVDNNIDVSKLKIMIELPIEQIYQERQEGISYRELGHKYGYTYEGIRKSLKKYCFEQNLDYFDDINDNQVVYVKK